MVEATFTNDDAATNRFDPGSVELVISDALNINTDAMAVTKSTIPVGHKNRYDKKGYRAKKTATRSSRKLCNSENRDFLHLEPPESADRPIALARPSPKPQHRLSTRQGQQSTEVAIKISAFRRQLVGL